MNEHHNTLSGVVAEHIAAVNAFDEEAVVATFAADALVNDVHREFWGTGAIRAWVAKEMVGDHVSIEVIEVLDHHGQIVVRGRYDGDYDKTNAALAIVGLGGALAVSPVRATRALHEWYIVPPEVRPGQRVRLLVCRAIGVGLVVGGAAFVVSITHLVLRSF